MRRYAIPKVAYIILVVMLACLSIGYTYAYFSAIATAESTATLGKIDVEWRDANHYAGIKSLFDNTSTQDVNEAMSISIKGALKRGDYTPIIADGIDGIEREVKLEISNTNGTVATYCRIKIEATYTPAGGEATKCDDNWIQLAITSGNTKKFITENGWFYSDGYYYFGKQTTDADNNVTRTLTALEASYGQSVADYLYLSDASSASMLGSTVNIILTLEGVQTTNEAYKTTWGVNW